LCSTPPAVRQIPVFPSRWQSTRYRPTSLWEFLEVLRPDAAVLAVARQLLGDPARVLEVHVAHHAVADDVGRVALQRGPLVYCLEAADNGPHLDELILPRDAKLAARFDAGLLGGATVVTGRARRIDRSGWRNALYRPARHHTKAARIRAVPYCVWNNRKAGEMLVWIRAGS